MAKIVLPPVTNTNTLSTINQNFDDIASALQNQVLYRDNPVGETNTVENALDLDGNDIFNVSTLSTSTLFIGDDNILDLIDGGAGQAAEDAIAAAAAAAISASAAASSATQAGTAIATAQAAADAAEDSATAAAASEAGAATAGATAGAAAATSAVNLLRSDLAADPAGGSFGGDLVAYRKLPAGVSVPYTVQEKLDTIIQASDFGFKTTNTGAQNQTALQNAVNFVNAVGGGTIEVAAGVYDITGPINIAVHNLGIRGAGMESTIFNQTTNNVTFHAGSATQYQNFSDFTLKHAVTQTDNAFYLFFSRASFFQRIKVQNHANAFNFYGFEQIVVRDLHAIAPSNAGAGIICGHAAPASTNTGANMLMEGCFLRGNDYLVGGNIVAGTYGVLIYDCEAVWMFNTDISNMDQSSMQFLPDWRTANHYFVQSFFDGTKNNHNVTFGGAGEKHNITFTGCWVCSAGQATFPSLGASRFGKTGFYVSNNGTYLDINVNGTRFFNNYGSGVWIEHPNPDFNFVGCSFYSNGVDALSAPWRHGFFISPASTQSLGLQINSSRFRGNGGNALRADGTARNNMCVGNYFEGAVSNDGAATYATFTGNV